MIDRDTSSAEIDTESDDIPVRDLSYFLYHFRAAYVTALNKVEQEHIASRISSAQAEKLVYAVAKEFGSMGYLSVSKNALADVPEEKELTFRNITRNNPIEIVFGAVEIALAAAVILSGGELEINKKGLRAKLPPLGVGIAELKKAFRGDFGNNYRSRITDDRDPDDPTDDNDNGGPDLDP